MNHQYTKQMLKKIFNAVSKNVFIYFSSKEGRHVTVQKEQKNIAFVQYVLDIWRFFFSVCTDWKKHFIIYYQQN